MKKAIVALGIIVFLLITVGVASATPALSTWYNNYTGDNCTTFTISHDDDRTVFFNVTANESIDEWAWYVDDELYQNTSADNITYTWDNGGKKNVSVYGSNANGQTDTLTWDIEIEYTTYEYGKLIYKQNNLLIKENEMIAQTWLFLVLLLIAFVFLGIGYLSPNSTFKIFGAMFSSLLFFLLSYAVVGNQFGEMLQMSWLATLLGALGLVQAIYTILLVISLLYMMFTSRRQAGMDSIPFDPQDKNW